MLLPAFGLFMSTMYLRYHYAVDLIAGAQLFVLAILVFPDRSPVFPDRSPRDVVAAE